jgi:hypothetical protein
MLNNTRMHMPMHRNVYLILVSICIILQLCNPIYAQDRPFRSDPVSMYTFSTSPVGPTNYTWESGLYGRNKGLAYLNGLSQYMDLAYLPDDRGNVFPVNFGGRSMTFEVVVKWAALRSWSHVFDFGSGPYNDVVFIGNFQSSSTTLRFATTGNCGTTACETLSDIAQVVTPNAFQHIVVTYDVIDLNDLTSATAANMTLYVDGIVRGNRLAYVPSSTVRQNHFLGKSNWAADSLFNGWIDSFYYYNYALDNQQVAAHYCTQARPAVFEIAFTEDPRITQGIRSATYTFQASEDSSGYHNGILVFDASQSNYVDLSATSGSSCIGTTILQTIGGAGGLTPAMALSLGLVQGWTFETVVKFTSSGNNAKVFDLSSTGTNILSLGYSGTTSNIVFKVSDSAAGTNTEFTVLSNAALNTWYHICIVLESTGTSTANYKAYINGQQLPTTASGIIPPTVTRGTNYIAKSSTSTDAYMNMKLDAMRIYDYALTASTIALLYTSTVSPLPSSAPAQTLGDPTVTSPVYRLNFDSVPPPQSQAHGTSFAYLPEVDGKTGVAVFDGERNYVNLAWHPDTDGKLFPQTIGGEMSVTAWVRYNTLGSWSRIFELAGIYSEYNNNIIFGIEGGTTNLALQSYQGSLASTLFAPGVITRYKWVHATMTIKQQLADPGAANAALLSIYINGNLVARGNGYLPGITFRPSTFLAKSAFLADAYFEGYMNTFNFYQYALSDEAVRAHSLSDKAPLYEAVFDTNPQLSTGATGYSWTAVDTEVVNSVTVNHNGLLSLSPPSNQWVNPLVANGTNGIGKIMPLIGGRGQSTGDQQGWTFEISFKARTLANEMRLFDFSDTSGGNRISLSYSNSAFTFASNSYRSSSVQITDSAIMANRWYHIAVVMKPDSAALNSGVLTAYLNGVLVATATGFDFPAYVARSQSAIGATYTSFATNYFDGHIDFFRVYDYAVASSSIRNLYGVFHLGQNVTALAQPTYFSTPANSWSFTNEPNGAIVTSATDFTWLSRSSDGRVGVAQFNGNLQRIALRQYEDDSYQPLAAFVGPATGTGSDGMAFEITLKYTGAAPNTVVFDLGAGTGSYSIVLSIVLGKLQFDVRGLDVSAAPVFTLQSPGQVGSDWNHVVINMASSSSTQATYTMYINNVLVTSAVGQPIPKVARDSCLLGRADWTGYNSFNGQIDNFAWYDHYLSSQTIAVHYTLSGNPGGVDLDFIIDPRPSALLTATSALYGWMASDPADSAAGVSQYHAGMLVFQKSLNQYANLLNPTGTTSLGTTLPSLGFRGSGVNSTLGYTFEWIVKIDSFANSAKIFYLASDAGDQVSLGFDGNSRDIVFYVRNTQTSSTNTMTVLWGAEASTWYHIAVVLTTTNFESGKGSWIAYVNGGQTNSLSPATLITAGGYSQAYLGYAPGAPYFDFKLDSFRYYPSALTANNMANIAPLYGLKPLPSKSGSSSSLSGGAIAGIVIGVIVGVILLILLCLFIRSRSRGSGVSKNNFKSQKDLADSTEDEIEMGETETAA